MPDFVAALLASAVFCLAVVALNGLTGLAIQAHLAPGALMEGGLLQYGGGLVLAGTTYRRAVRTQDRVVGE